MIFFEQHQNPKALECFQQNHKHENFQELQHFVNNFLCKGRKSHLKIDCPRYFLGNNEGSLFLNAISYPYIENYLQSVGVPENFHAYGFVENTPAPWGSGAARRISNINITDLGTSSTIDATNSTYNWGETIKGSYEGTLYFLSSIPEGFTIPVPIMIGTGMVKPSGILDKK